MKDYHKLFYISWIIPPAKGGSAYITHQLAKHFDANEIVVIGGSRIPFLGNKLYDGVRYHYFFTELNWRGHGDRYFLFLRWLLFPVFLCNYINLIRKEKHLVGSDKDFILATFPDGYYLLAAWLAARYLKLNLFSYFHNTYVENRHGISKWIAKKLQHRIFTDSRKIFLMSEGLLDYYKNAYPLFSSKFVVLPHTFDKYPSVSSPVKIADHAAPYKLVMIGTLNHSNMEATLRLLKLISKYPEKYQVDIYSPTNKQILKYKWGLDLDFLGINYKGFVVQEEVNQLISNYDVCLLTHGFTGEYSEIEYRTIFPTRMIPLMLSGKPILAHSPEHSFLNKFIRKYDCAEIVSQKSDTELLSALEKLTTDQNRVQQLVENAKKASTYFYGPNVIKSLKKEIQRD